MKLKFNNEDNYIRLQRYTSEADRIYIKGNGITENLSGFVLYEDDGETVVRDCSDYIYRWNVLTEREDGIILTNSETDRETEEDAEQYRQRKEAEKNPDGTGREVVFPLSNDELTEAVADLMYEVSMAQLGL